MVDASVGSAGGCSDGRWGGFRLGKEPGRERRIETSGGCFLPFVRVHI